MNFKPIGTNVLIEFEPNKPVGGIELPAQMETFDYSMFVVRAVGNGYLAQNGVFVPLPLNVGDRVGLHGSAAGNMIKLGKHLTDGKDMAVIDVRHILGVFEGELPEPKAKGTILAPASAVRKLELVH